MPDDDRAARARLDALEAEVKAEADVARQRKEAALARLRAQRAAQQAERDTQRARDAELVAQRARGRRPSDAPPAGDTDHDMDGLGSALSLARKADGVRADLAKPRKPGDKNWVTSALLSTALGPIGWLYAGSFREAIPAAVAWLALAAIVTKVLPFVTFLMLPVLLVALPLSGLAGLMYAYQYNKTGKRSRLFTGDDKKKLPPGGAR